MNEKCAAYTLKIIEGPMTHEEAMERAKQEIQPIEELPKISKHRKKVKTK